MSLKATLQEMKKEKEANLPADKLNIMHQATADLVKSGIVEQVLKAGVQAPAFILPDEQERAVSSEALVKEGPLVINFYRGIW